MNRDEFERWMEEELERPAAAPAGFADRVMERVRAEALPARAEPRLSAPPRFWTRVLRQPATILALLLGVLTAAAGPSLLRQVNEALLRGGRALDQAYAVFGLRCEAWQGTLPPLYTSLLWKTTLALGLLPALLWLSWRLYKWPQSEWMKPRGWRGAGR